MLRFCPASRHQVSIAPFGSGHNRDQAMQQTELDHLVGGHQQGLRRLEPERPVSDSEHGLIGEQSGCAAGMDENNICVGMPPLDVRTEVGQCLRCRVHPAQSPAARAAFELVRQRTSPVSCQMNYSCKGGNVFIVGLPDGAVGVTGVGVWTRGGMTTAVHSRSTADSATPRKSAACVCLGRRAIA